MQAQPKSTVYCTPSPGNKPRETIVFSRTGEIKLITGANHVITPSPASSSSKACFDHPVPVRVIKSAARRVIQFNKPPEEGSTSAIAKNLLQSPDYEMAMMNETSPMPGSTFENRTLKRNMVEVDLTSPGDKKVRLELPTPPCGSTVRDSFSIIGTSPSSIDITPESSRVTTLKRINSTPIQASPASGDSKSFSQIIVHKIVNKPSGSVKKLLSTPTSLESVTLTPGSSFKTISTGAIPAAPYPIRIIENPASSSLSTSATQSLVSNLSSLSQPFPPPSAPMLSPQVARVPVSLKKLLNGSSSSTSSGYPSVPPSQHSASSPFKIVVPSGKTSDGLTTTTTFLVKMANPRISKTLSM